jgi:RNase adapter protein RapZ
VALGIDSRGREFLDEVPVSLDEVRRRGHRVETIYLEAGDDSLVRRFGETRRPHPMAEGSDVAAGIRRERERLAPLRAHADRVIDTSALTTHQLREQLGGLFASEHGEGALRVALVSFGFKFGVPADADVLWDVRFLPNPFWVEELRPRTGLDASVAEYVLEQPDSMRFLALVDEYLGFTLPLHEKEGRTYLNIAIGCTGGRHRSVCLVEALRERLDARGFRATTRHRDVER